jgi:hypothetical protein
MVAICKDRFPQKHVHGFSDIHPFPYSHPKHTFPSLFLHLRSQPEYEKLTRLPDYAVAVNSGTTQEHFTTVSKASAAYSSTPLSPSQAPNWWASQRLRPLTRDDLSRQQ